ncbi:hypothetical protein SNE510_34420 [Streptomyces sp. NE5-10]|uniref:DUF397 domain-containing protein n=1 Tax=Streptomyces sp. NE5-10 TaxID=2759674 RepID=UPI0019081B3D|nr:DUF397 domain-containing protein [Streptomyces sp. NE5-10]GHJ93923.1 hypothetical protein SNE510_34420 [Streptomyces sp. NE5-10]
MTTESPHWIKSSYSNNGGNCVEVAHNLAPTLGLVPLRDSKVPAGPSLTVSATAFTVFVDSFKGR